MPDDPALGDRDFDLFSPSVEDNGVFAVGVVGADTELFLDLGGDSARNGLSCLAVVALRDLGDRGDDPDRAPALEGDGPGDPGESFLPPRDLVIPAGRRDSLLTNSGAPLCSYLPLFCQLGSLSLHLFRDFLLFCFWLPFCAARPNRSESERQKGDRLQKAGKDLDTNHFISFYSKNLIEIYCTKLIEYINKVSNF